MKVIHDILIFQSIRKETRERRTEQSVEKYETQTEICEFSEDFFHSLGTSTKLIIYEIMEREWKFFD